MSSRRLYTAYKTHILLNLPFAELYANFVVVGLSLVCICLGIKHGLPSVTAGVGYKLGLNKKTTCIANTNGIWFLQDLCYTSAELQARKDAERQAIIDNSMFNRQRRLNKRVNNGRTYSKVYR